MTDCMTWEDACQDLHYSHNLQRLFQYIAVHLIGFYDALQTREYIPVYGVLQAIGNSIRAAI